MKRIVLKEELAVITGDYKLAMVLNQMMYWSRRTKNRDGWVYKSGQELAEDMLMNVSAYSMRTYLKKLTQLGFMEERRNPVMKWDKTMQYRVCWETIQGAVENAGYSWEEESVSNVKNSVSKKENTAAIPENPAKITPERREDPLASLCIDQFGMIEGLEKRLAAWRPLFQDFEAVLREALAKAASYGARSFSYVEKMLESWKTVKRPFTQMTPVKTAPVPAWLSNDQPVIPSSPETLAALRQQAELLKEGLAAKKRLRRA
ncbi:hypothetical protein [Alkalicoccus luteus]|uniref:DnaD domain protein n=1 Tax=Alkalicoccus luteus TaxID=1237094 RepID=A0A969PQA9_9BACI|nr:hypothetical protein [Alkalicoccus luteus]NJP38435.1 hypothetical protein [Alkalicoccus luteus]